MDILLAALLLVLVLLVLGLGLAAGRPEALSQSRRVVPSDLRQQHD